MEKCEHEPVVEVYTTRYILNGELIEIEQEYIYCKKCKELLPNPKEETDEIPF
jgi:hypothetical protein